MRAIELRDVRFSYRKGLPEVLKGLDMSCEEGSVNVLLGLNGSGKTTLIRCLVGLLEPSSGNVSYFGTDLLHMDFDDRSRILAYVQQSSAPIGDYFVRDYLLFGTANRLDFFESPGADERSLVDDLMGRFGITGLKTRRLGELSGGQRQIVSICSSMVQDSKVIVLDEPLSELDTVNQNRVLGILKDISSEDGKTVVFSTHDPNHAYVTGLETEVFLLKDGRISDHGSAEEIIVPERLKHIYGENICYSDELPYREVSFKG